MPCYGPRHRSRGRCSVQLRSTSSWSTTASSVRSAQPSTRRSKTLTYSSRTAIRPRTRRAARPQFPSSRWSESLSKRTRSGRRSRSAGRSGRLRRAGSFAGLRAEGAVPVCGRLLHVYVHQIARIPPLVTDWPGFADRQAGVQIDVPQQRHVVSVEDLRHRRLGQAQMVADPVRSPPPAETQRDDESARRRTHLETVALEICSCSATRGFTQPVSHNPYRYRRSSPS